VQEHPTSDKESQAIKRFEEGYDAYNIALHTDLKRDKVIKIISEYLLKKGQTVEYIAEKLETSTMVVYAVAKAVLSKNEFKNLKIQTDIYREELTPRILGLFESGLDPKSISQRIKVPVTIVRRKLVTGLLKSGQTADDIAISLNLKFSVIYHIAKESLSNEEFNHSRKMTKEARGISKKESLTNISNLVFTMSDCGISVSKISDACKISIQNVNSILANPRKTKDDTQNSKFSVAQTVLEQLNDGKTLEEVGQMIGLTRERVRQIAKMYHYSLKEQKKKRKRATDNTQALLEQRIKSWIVQHPGCYLSEIASRFNLTEEETWTLCPKSTHAFILAIKKQPSTSKIKYSREEALGALNKAYEMRNPLMDMYSVNETRPLTGPFYEKLRKTGQIYGPSHARILQVFGTWKAACEEADVPSIDSVRDSYELLWTDKQLIEQLAEFLSSTESPSIRKFDEWSRLDNSRASYGTIKNQIGPWFESCELALLHLRRNWTAD
jgi:hypothetical protein